MTNAHDLQRLLRTQDGLVTRTQLLRIGWSSSSIDRRLAVGDWERVHPRVYRAVDHPWTLRARLRAVGLWLPPGGVLTGEAAAVWHGYTDRPPSTIPAAIPPPGRRVAPSGVILARRVLAPQDVITHDGIGVTRPALTVLEAAVALGLLDGARLMDRALQREQVSVPELRAAFDRTAGRAGSKLARRLLDLAAGGARSEAERTALRGLRAAGIGGWVANHEVRFPGWGRVVLDIAFPELRLAIEVDGWAFHRDVDAFRRDRLRQNEVVVGGWRVLRVTWYELVEDLPRFIDTVRRALSMPVA